MRSFKELSPIEKRARKASGNLNCEKCPAGAKCNGLVWQVCDYVYLAAYRRGYNDRKKEETASNKK